ncbi:hypothetical protein D3C78_20630 [compost metagenome]
MNKTKEIIMNAQNILFSVGEQKELSCCYTNHGRDALICVPGQTAFEIFNTPGKSEIDSMLFIDSQGYLSVVWTIKHLGVMDIDRIKKLPVTRDKQLHFLGSVFFDTSHLQIEHQPNCVIITCVTFSGTNTMKLVQGHNDYITVETKFLYGTKESIMFKNDYLINHPTTGQNRARYHGNKLFISFAGMCFILLEGIWVETSSDWIQIYAPQDIQDEYLAYVNLED